VAVLATGDELVEPEEQPLPYQIRNSNGYSLAAQILAAGGDPLQFPIARDERAALDAILHQALDADVDLLLFSGGVSAGKYDLVEEVLLTLGAEFFFTGVLIQPGKPVVFGRLPSKGTQRYFFGLPGNPVSTMVTFSLFVQPLLAALAGEPFRYPRFAQARLEVSHHGKTGLTRFLPAVLRADPGQPSTEPSVLPIPWKGSGDLANTSQANCFLVVPANRDSLDAGETVTILLEPVMNL
jgi:molybdopterin molybdotransferase